MDYYAVIKKNVVNLVISPLTFLLGILESKNNE